MKSQKFNIEGLQILSRESQRVIMGSGFGISQCGCSCSGAVTGPAYCHKVMACPQVYTCNDEI